MTDLADPLLPLLRERGLIDADEGARVAPLSGGVSCDVWRVDRANAPPLVVKRALPRLRVATEWLAPVERIDSEVRWLRLVHAHDATFVPEVLAYWPDAHMFAMPFLPGRPVWKDELAAGRVDRDFAAQVGKAIAAVHATTAFDPAASTDFANEHLFEALRIEPFIRHVAAHDQELEPRLTALADALATTRIALVHGDVSPKNILVGGNGPVLLDAECAVFGDPAFDIAFCTTHLLLKQVWLPEFAPALCDATAALVGAYRDAVDWEPPDGLMARAGALTGALLLARIDGKSPVPYLGEAERTRVRTRARRMIDAEPLPLDRLVIEWYLEETEA